MDKQPRVFTDGFDSFSEAEVEAMGHEQADLLCDAGFHWGSLCDQNEQSSPSKRGSSDRDIAGRQNTDVSRDHQQPSSDASDKCRSKLADRNESDTSRPQPPRDQAIADFFNLALDITMVRFL